MTTVRGITSRVDIVWSSDDGSILYKQHNISTKSSTDNIAKYSNTYTITPLSVHDDDRTYQCEALINSKPLVSASDDVTLDVTGR